MIPTTFPIPKFNERGTNYCFNILCKTMLGYIPNAIIIIPDFCLDHSFPVYIGIQAKQFDKLLIFNSSIIFLAKHIKMLPTRQTALHEEIVVNCMVLPEV